MKKAGKAWQLAVLLAVTLVAGSYGTPMEAWQSSPNAQKQQPPSTSKSSQRSTMLEDLTVSPQRARLAEITASKPVPIPEEAKPGELVPSLSALINADRELVQLRDLEGAERKKAIKEATTNRDFALLREHFAKEKFEFDLAGAKAMEASYLRSPLRITIVSVPGRGTAATTSASITVATANDGTSLTLGHSTNLGTSLEVPISPTRYPVFYIHCWVVKHGQLIPWRYWWYDSHHHPNWFYSGYYRYYRYWWYYRNHWPYWYNWFWGWYYGYHWHYWSTWFPW
jgi:hypothetical protein